MVECRTLEWEVGGSKPTAALLCPWARHFTPRKYWLITQEAVAPSRHDWKIVDWDVKPQHKQTNRTINRWLLDYTSINQNSGSNIPCYRLRRTHWYTHYMPRYSQSSDFASQKSVLRQKFTEWTQYTSLTIVREDITSQLISTCCQDWMLELKISRHVYTLFQLNNLSPDLFSLYSMNLLTEKKNCFI